MKLVNNIVNLAKTNSPTLLIGAGVASMATSTVLAVGATPRALDNVRDYEDELGVNGLTKRDLVKCTWKEYIPAAGFAVLGIGCIVVGTSQHIKKNTALATVYALSENTLKEYQKQTRELIGEEKAKEIERSVAKARVKAKHDTVINEDPGSLYVAQTGMGDTLVYDTLSGRFFRSSTVAIEAAVNATNKIALDDGYVSVNDFYNELDIPAIGAGDLIGWSYEGGLLETNFDSDTDRVGNPYVILSYVNRPVPLSRAY